MRAVAIGTETDVLGLRLAGVPGTACRTRREAEAAFDRLEGDVALVLVSAPIADLVPARVAALETDPSAPVILVLPETGGGR